MKSVLYSPKSQNILSAADQGIVKVRMCVHLYVCTIGRLAGCSCSSLNIVLGMLTASVMHTGSQLSELPGQVSPNTQFFIVARAD